MRGFLGELPHLWELYKKDQEDRRQKASILQQGVTEEFIKGLMATAEEGVEATITFPGGISLTITRHAQHLETLTSSGLRTKESF